MILNVEQTVFEYLEKYGYLFENDATILYEELKNKDEIIRIKLKYEKKKIELEKKHKSKIEKLKDFVKEVGKEYGKEMVEEFEDKIQLQTQRLRALHYLRLKELNKAEIVELSNVSKSKVALIVTGIGLASLIIYTSFKNYMLNKKITRLKCKGLSGGKLNQCIKNEKIRMLNDRILFLKKAIPRCNHSKDPVKCKDKIDEEILRLEGRAKSYFLDLGKKILRGASLE